MGEGAAITGRAQGLLAHDTSDSSSTKRVHASELGALIVCGGTGVRTFSYDDDGYLSGFTIQRHVNGTAYTETYTITRNANNKITQISAATIT